jgi:hypothetical protein
MTKARKKKKGTGDTRAIVADIQREAEADQITLAVKPGLEKDQFGFLIIPEIRSQIDFINIVETIDPSQSPS